jgi:hypothetical protein
MAIFEPGGRFWVGNGRKMSGNGGDWGDGGKLSGQQKKKKKKKGKYRKKNGYWGNRWLNKENQGS